MTGSANAHPPPLDSSEAIIIVKAAPQLGGKHGETVCTAGITRDRRWLRLFPIAFRSLAEAQQFKRWNVVSFQSRQPRDDRRQESRRVEHQSLVITGELASNQRFELVEPMVKQSLNAEREAGRSLAFIRPAIRKFSIERRKELELRKDKERFATYAEQQDFFLKPLVPYEPCPYAFKYEYEIADGRRTGTCQDWETEATFFHWAKRYGEKAALEKMQAIWGDELPRKGLLFAMGTHSLYPDVWLINGLVQLPERGQLGLTFDAPAVVRPHPDTF